MANIKNNGLKSYSQVDIDRMKNMSRGQGFKKGKEEGRKKGIYKGFLIAIGSFLLIAGISTVSYITYEYITNKDFNLANEIKVTNLGEFEKIPNANEIKNMVLTKNKDAVATNFKIVNLQISEDGKSGTAEATANKLFSNSIVKLTFTIKTT